MKHILISFTLLMAFLPAMSQPAWVKKSTKAVFTLKTFDPAGTLIGSSTGFFIAETGEAISCYTPFRGAERAVVIDAVGKEWPVDYILGANETYDVAKFHVEVKKPQPLSVASDKLPETASVWLLPYREVNQVPQGTVKKTETFNDQYAYYTVTIPANEAMAGAPLINDAGEVIGIMQAPYTPDDSLSYAVSAAFADSLHITGLSINETALRAIHIKKALPKDINQALLTLFVSSSALDSADYAQLVNDFIAQFPNSPDGYIYRAELAAAADACQDADKDMAKAIKVAEKPDEPHYSYSRLIMQKLVSRPEPPYEPWTMDKALEEARAANAINPQPTYRMQEADVLFAKKDYQGASDIYQELSQGPLRSPDIFYEAARCRILLGDTVGQLALLDSMMALHARPFLKEAAPYILARAQARLDANKYRDAVSDLNDYEQLMVAQVNENFYYLRFQAEVGGRLFQQALNDIDRAISMNPSPEFYLAEKASLQVRVGLYDEAVETSQQCISKAPTLSDGYLFLGLAQCLKGEKQEGVKNLQKARELGDTQADALIEKYGQQ